MCTITYFEGHVWNQPVFLSFAVLAWEKDMAATLRVFHAEYKIQTHKRLKGMPFIRTKHNMWIFGVIPFIKLQNDT